MEAKLAALEGAEAACLFASGMAAVTTTLLAMLRSEAHVVFTNDCYRKTRQFAESVLKKVGVACDLVPPRVDAIEAALRPNTRLIFTESPTNPYLGVVDLESLSALARSRRIKTVVDSTFATPFNQRPLQYGIDLVVHSATKYLGGHNDLLAGAILGGRDLVGAIREFQGMLGGIPDPTSSYLLARGLKTFGLRLERQNESGQRIAEFLEKHPRVARVHYPGLPSHPDHEVARRQMRGFGGVVSFEIRGSPRGSQPLRGRRAHPPDRSQPGRAWRASSSSPRSCPSSSSRPRSGASSGSRRTWCACRSGSRTRTTSSATWSRRSVGSSPDHSRGRVTFRVNDPFWAVEGPSETFEGSQAAATE